VFDVIAVDTTRLHAGTGYVSALLAHLAAPGGMVLAIEKQVIVISDAAVAF
jgi:protein-L-isoaspartate O-methyltransferase